MKEVILTMEECSIVFSDGDIEMLVAMNITLKEAQKMIKAQISPECYTIIRGKPNLIYEKKGS